MARLIAVIALLLTILLLGCETTPAPPVVGNLTERDIETALADTMMITANSMLYLLRDDGKYDPDGELEREGLRMVWSGADLEAEMGEFTIELTDYRLLSSLWSDVYKGYIATGTVYFSMDGTAAVLDVDLRLSHRQPERYPVTSLDVELSGLEDEIDPDNVHGHIIVNGYKVPLDYSLALEVSN